MIKRAWHGDWLACGLYQAKEWSFLFIQDYNFLNMIELPYLDAKKKHYSASVCNKEATEEFKFTFL